MKTKVIGLIVAAGLASCALYACSTNNPPPPCNVGHGDYAAKYLIQTPSGNAACDGLKGEAIGIDKFYKLDGGVSEVAMQPAQASGAVPTASDGTLYTIGNLDSEQPVDDFCTVKGLNKISAQTEGEPTTADISEDGGFPEDAGIDLTTGTVDIDTDAGTATFTPNPVPFTYEFSDTKFFIVPLAPSAQQFTTTLKYSDTTAGCTATYKVIGMYPAVSCTSDVDCDPNADYDAGRLFGSGINDKFITFCDPDTGLCQLKADDIGPGTLKQ